MNPLAETMAEHRWISMNILDLLILGSSLWSAYNVCDVVSLASGSSHCPLSPVPCRPLKINPKGVYPMERTLKVELYIQKWRPKRAKKSS